MALDLSKSPQDYQKLAEENDLLEKRNEELLLQVSQMQQKIDLWENNDSSISLEDTSVESKTQNFYNISKLLKKIWAKYPKEEVPMDSLISFHC